MSYLRELHQKDDCYLSTSYQEFLERRCEELEEANRWIPVSERLPEMWKFCIVYCMNEKCVHYCFWNGEAWEDQLGIDLWDVTHWQPLPAMPEEVQG